LWINPIDNLDARVYITYIKRAAEPPEVTTGAGPPEATTGVLSKIRELWGTGPVHEDPDPLLFVWSIQ
jgi:hypothetical protein